MKDPTSGYFDPTQAVVNGGGAGGMNANVASVAYCDSVSTDLVASFTAWARSRAGI